LLIDVDGHATYGQILVAIFIWSIEIALEEFDHLFFALDFATLEPSNGLSQNREIAGSARSG
jgi:hypothetical protein